jgi:nucleoside-diphosphate-sugar epimerase
MILVTGGGGFVGKQLCTHLGALGEEFRVSTRAPCGNATQVGDICETTDWHMALQGVETVIHLAARVHVMSDTAADPLFECRRVNVHGTLNLARQALAAGVRRFVFISSIKVNGEGTSPGRAYTAADAPAPADPYGISKHEAENALRKLANETGLEVVIIRPPLVYGPGVKANFLSMMRWLHQGGPLPLGAIHNQRSLVALDNLVDLIVTCIDHPSAANQTFLVSDGEDVSTTELLHRMGAALGRPARLIPVPAWCLETGGSLLGKRAVVQRLCGSLQVDISKTQTMLGWTPPISVDDALARTARHFLDHLAQ